MLMARGFTISSNIVLMAGLLTPPPVQRPSHLVMTKQWHKDLSGFPFSIRKGGVTAAGPYRICTGFPRMPFQAPIVYDQILGACIR